MNSTRGITDEQVEAEIARLTENEYVKLARAEERLRYARRQYLYKLRWLENRGKELADAGFTVEDMADAARREEEEA